MIVVDSNILAYLWIPGEFSDLADEIYQKDSKWVAPFLWRSEFRNILAGYMRARGMDLVEAIE